MSNLVFASGCVPKLATPEEPEVICMDITAQRTPWYEAFLNWVGDLFVGSSEPSPGTGGMTEEEKLLAKKAEEEKRKQLEEDRKKQLAELIKQLQDAFEPPCPNPMEGEQAHRARTIAACIDHMNSQASAISPPGMSSTVSAGAALVCASPLGPDQAANAYLFGGTCKSE